MFLKDSHQLSKSNIKSKHFQSNFQTSRLASSCTFTKLFHKFQFHKCCLNWNDRRSIFRSILRDSIFLHGISILVVKFLKFQSMQSDSFINCADKYVPIFRLNKNKVFLTIIVIEHAHNCFYSLLQLLDLSIIENLLGQYFKGKKFC